MSAPLIHHRLCLSPSLSFSLSLSDRAVASVLQGGCPGEQYRGEEALGMHSQHYVSRATNLREFFLVWAAHYLLLWTVRITSSSIWRCGWGVCQQKAAHLKRLECVQVGYEVIWSDVRIWEFGIISAGLSCFKPNCVWLLLQSQKTWEKPQTPKIQYEHSESTHTTSGLFLFCFKWQHWVFLFYLAPTRYPSIS